MPAAVLQPVRIPRRRLTWLRPLALLATLDARYRTRVRLEQLDDRLLQDIGVTRADVAAELRRPLF